MSGELDGMMMTVLQRLERLALGATQAWNKSGGGSGEPDDRFVALVAKHEDPPHIHYRKLYYRETTDGARRLILEEAKGVLDHWTHGPYAPRRVLGEVKEAPSITFEQIVIDDGVGWTPEEVGQRFNVAPGLVRRIRQRKNRGTEDGRPIVPAGDLAARAREMRARGVTTRQIADNLGVHQKQVMRWIKTEEAA